MGALTMAALTMAALTMAALTLTMAAPTTYLLTYLLTTYLAHLLVDAAHREAELVAIDAPAAVGVEEGEDGLVLGDPLVAHLVLALQRDEVGRLVRVRVRVRMRLAACSA